MQIYSNLEIKDTKHLVHSIYPSTDDILSTPPSLLQIYAPYRLQSITFHPQDDNQHLMLATFSPDSVIYMALEKKDIGFDLNNYIHQHNFYEFIFVLDGELHQNIERNKLCYKKGEVFILNKHIRHCIDFSSDKDFQIVLLQVSTWLLDHLVQDLSMKMFEEEREHIVSTLEYFLKNDLQSNTNANKSYLNLVPFFDISHITYSIHHLLDDIAKETLLPKLGSSYEVKKLLFELLLTLSMTPHFKATPVNLDNNSENMLFDQISTIMEETHGRATRKDLQDTLHYSGTYLNNITKKYTGLTIFHYGMTFCMKEAVRLLLKTDLNISTISTELGFSNRTHFYRVFHNLYGMTPAEFRKAHKTLNKNPAGGEIK